MAMVKIIRVGKATPEEVDFENIHDGDTFFVNGIPHVADGDAHYSGDASYDGYLVYSMDGESWFPENLDRIGGKDMLTFDAIVKAIQQKQSAPNCGVTFTTDGDTIFVDFVGQAKTQIADKQAVVDVVADFIETLTGVEMTTGRYEKGDSENDALLGMYYISTNG